jgi:hypothetical protein
VKKLPSLRCLECLVGSIGALGASSPFDDLSVDGGGVDPAWGGEPDAQVPFTHNRDPEPEMASRKQGIALRCRESERNKPWPPDCTSIDDTP